MQKTIHVDAFLSCVEDLLASPVVRRMGTFSHHHRVSCLEHSISVAYISYLIVRRLGGDARAAARGGLLHDLFLYDRREPGSHQGFHGTTHPKIALRNALRYFEPTRLECEIIRCHMFPLGLAVPHHVESITVSLVDKVCAMYEFAGAFNWFSLAERVAEIMA